MSIRLLFNLISIYLTTMLIKQTLHYIRNELVPRSREVRNGAYIISEYNIYGMEILLKEAKWEGA